MVLVQTWRPIRWLKKLFISNLGSPGRLQQPSGTSRIWKKPMPEPSWCLLTPTLANPKLFQKMYGTAWRQPFSSKAGITCPQLFQVSFWARMLSKLHVPRAGERGWARAQYYDFGLKINDLRLDFQDWGLRIGMGVQDLGIGVQDLGTRVQY